MALIDFQTALGRLVRAPDGGDPLRRLSLDNRERSSIAALTGSAGFRVTVAIQRSWCEGRAAKAAHLTLSLVHEHQRKRLIEEWTASGAGTSSFFEAEGDAFLEFLSARLDDPSQALSMCRIELATLRASERAGSFVKPDLSRLDDPECVVRASRFSALVHCDTEPHLVLFGPGLDGLWRPASREEAELWARLSAAVAVRELLQAGYERGAMEALLDAGAMEYEGTG
jgi:hypothetical protein